MNAQNHGKLSSDLNYTTRHKATFIYTIVVTKNSVELKLKPMPT